MPHIPVIVLLAGILAWSSWHLIREYIANIQADESHENQPDDQKGEV